MKMKAVLVLGAIALWGCGTAGTSSDGGVTPPPDSGAGELPVTGPYGFGLPCDVTRIMQDHCWSCHGEKLAPGAQVHLMTVDDFRAQSPLYPNQTVGDRSVTLMAVTGQGAMPPPPEPPVPAGDQSLFSAWVTYNMPGEFCTLDGGVTSVCSSGQTWTWPETAGSANMNPGMACVSCHEQNFGPSLVVGGTVYPTNHEPDKCLGESKVHVEIIDAQGGVHAATTNSSGNFYFYAGESIPLPFHARVVNTTTGATHTMYTAQTTGDCNSCHTEHGANGAPGRIYAP